MTKHGKAGPVVSPQELTAEASYAEILKICEFANGLKFEQLCWKGAKASVSHIAPVFAPVLAKLSVSCRPMT